MKIVDGRTYHMGASVTDYRKARMVPLAARQLVQVPTPDVVDAKAPPAEAWIYRTWWVATCPDCGRCTCFVWKDEPVFMCISCWNGKIGGRWRSVKFPVEAEEIERTLEVRIYPDNHNWRPGETVADLHRENLEHGLVKEAGR